MTVHAVTDDESHVEMIILHWVWVFKKKKTYNWNKNDLKDLNSESKVHLIYLDFTSKNFIYFFYDDVIQFLTEKNWWIRYISRKS